MSAPAHAAGAAPVLRGRAEALAAPLPPLLARAERLAASVLPGGHGRRRAGTGEAFWQFRPAVPGDPARSLDWRRSAMGDHSYVRQTEWEAPQTVLLWVDRSRSMAFSEDGRPPKRDRAALLALALSILLLRGGERVGLAGGAEPPRAGRARAEQLAVRLSELEDAEYGAPPATIPARGARLVLISDFLGDPAPALSAVRAAAGVGSPGTLLQVVDPAEEAFPYEGRTLFTSMGGALTHDTRAAGGLRARYVDRMSERRALLADAARRAGFGWRVHRTDASAGHALRALWQELSGSAA